MGFLTEIYTNPLPILFSFPASSYSLTNLSKIPLINTLLLGVEYSFAISRYSLMVTLTGMDGKFLISQMAICNNTKSTFAIRSESQFWVLTSLSLLSAVLLRSVFLHKSIANCLSSISLYNLGMKCVSGLDGFAFRNNFKIAVFMVGRSSNQVRFLSSIYSYSLSFGAITSLKISTINSLSSLKSEVLVCK